MNGEEDSIDALAASGQKDFVDESRDYLAIVDAKIEERRMKIGVDGDDCLLASLDPVLQLLVDFKNDIVASLEQGVEFLDDCVFAKQQQPRNRGMSILDVNHIELGDALSTP